MVSPMNVPTVILLNPNFSSITKFLYADIGIEMTSEIKFVATTKIAAVHGSENPKLLAKSSIYLNANVKSRIKVTERDTISVKLPNLLFAAKYSCCLRYSSSL